MSFQRNPATTEQQARQLIWEAEKKITTKSSFFQLLFGNNDTNKQEAIQYYQRAGKLFKIANNWQQAGAAFRIAADLNSQTNIERCEAANDYVSAAKCFENCDVIAAINGLLCAIEIYTAELGRFAIAAKHHQTIAELYESQLLDCQNAIQHYEQAAEYFRTEDNYFQASKCLLKVAQFAAENENYKKAISIYQDLALTDLKKSILQYSAKEKFFRAVLCNLCIDVLEAKFALDFYVSKYPAFELSREYKFLMQITECVEDGDVDDFTKIVKDYNNVSRFDEWFTKILLRIKRKINDYPNLL